MDTRRRVVASPLLVALLVGFTLIMAASTRGGEAASPAPRTQEQTVRTDLLTFAQGALFVSQSGMASGSAGRALRVIDGDPRKLTLAVDGRDPIELVFKLPANTTFDRLAIPNVVETPGNATFFRNVVISGSLEGPEGDYQVLAQAELETHGADEEFTELELLASTPIRYVKMHLSDGINIVEGQEGRTNLEFTEIIGNGTQEEHELSTAFTGLWDFRLTERLDRSAGMALELTQAGATIFGCLGHVVLHGSVNGRIARANGIDVRNDRTTALIMVADDDDAIQAVMSVNRGRFGARTAVVDPGIETPPCAAEAQPEPKFCGISVYVNFAFDSAEILPESTQILTNLYEGLIAAEATSVSIEGHTSTEGSVEYNLNLSQRRAQAVVDELVARGFPARALTAVGRGESRPLMRPDNDESSRAMNRRVEIECGQAG